LDDAPASAVAVAAASPTAAVADEPEKSLPAAEKPEEGATERGSAPPPLEAIERESAPPAVEAIAPVTFSERPPAVQAKGETPAPATAVKEIDPTPSGPVRSETPLSTGPETFDPVTSLEPARRGPNWALIAAAAAVVVLVGYWIQRGPAGPKAAATATAVQAEVKPAAEPPKVEAPKPEAPATAAPPSEPSAAASAAPANSAAPIPAATPTASANDAKPEPAPTASTAPATEGSKTISIVTRPPGARLFDHGKDVGTTPLTIELAPGEKRRFEVGLPGHITRKLIVDGTKTEIVLGLRPGK
jgi:hypothetical protein